MSSDSAIKILFSDLDGTCIHYDHEGLDISPHIDPRTGMYPCSIPDQPILLTSLLKLPPSSSGAVGVISFKTLQLYATLRSMGIRLILISGGRLSTIMQRLPFLPNADAIICESGGRIFYPSSPTITATHLPTAAPWVEDLEWRRVHEESTGPLGQDGIPPDQRQGTLWNYYLALSIGASDRVRLDSASYTTAFRIKGAEDALEAVRQSIPLGLSTSYNLGSADVYPCTSGKVNAGMYMLEKWGGITPNESAFLCDDDNDMELAALVGKVYVPCITADSVAEAVKARPDKFIVSGYPSVFATEKLLETIIRSQLCR
jgi:hypothetical protein